jgi:hypothetical protein
VYRRRNYGEEFRIQNSRGSFGSAGGFCILHSEFWLLNSSFWCLPSGTIPPRTVALSAFFAILPVQAAEGGTTRYLPITPLNLAPRCFGSSNAAGGVLRNSRRIHHGGKPDGGCLGASSPGGFQLLRLARSTYTRTATLPACYLWPPIPSGPRKPAPLRLSPMPGSGC